MVRWSTVDAQLVFSPGLLKIRQAAAQQTTLRSVEFELRKASGTAKSPAFETVTLTNVHVASSRGASGPSELPTELVAFDFQTIEWAYSQQNADGSMKPPLTLSWDRAAGVGQVAGTPFNGSSPDLNFAFDLNAGGPSETDTGAVEAESLIDNGAGAGEPIGGSETQKTDGSSLYHLLAFLQATPTNVRDAYYKKGNTSPTPYLSGVYANATMAAVLLGPLTEQLTWKADHVTMTAQVTDSAGNQETPVVVTYP